MPFLMITSSGIYECGRSENIMICIASTPVFVPHLSHN
jgi:hypothetical protein